MTFTPKLSAIFAVGLCLTARSGAQPPAESPSPAPEPKPSPTLLTEVVVLASRMEEPAERLGSAYTKITGDELVRDQLNHVKQAVNLSPGVFASEAGQTGGGSEISIRGNRPDHTLLLVDGVRANTAMFTSGMPFLSYASTMNLEAIEIVRGPYSPLFGSEAVGGVVSLQTRRGHGRPETSLFFEAGSYDTFRGGLLSGGSLGPLDYSLHYAHEETANDRINNDLRIDSGSLRIDWTVSESLTLGLAFRTQAGRYQEPGSVRPLDYDSNDPNAETTAESTSLSTYLELRTTEIWTQRFTLGYFRERYTFYNPANPPVFDPVPPPYSYVADSANFSADWQNTIEIADRNRLIAGTTVLYQTGHDNTFPWQTTTDVGFYLQDQWEIVENLTVIGGVRLDHHELSGDAFTYRLAGAYFLEPTRTKFRASYGTAFKSPGFFQLFSTSAFALGNPGLKPERSESWDAGIDQYFFGDRIALSATYFHNSISDLIAFVETSPFTGTYLNRDSAESYGIETSATAKINDRWQARVVYTWTESFESTPLATFRPDYRPRHVIGAETSYTFFGRLTLGAGVYYVAQREALDFAVFPAQKVDVEDYTLVRLHGRYDFNDHVSVFGRIENLTDQEYETRIGFPGSGRGFYAGAEIRF